MPKKIQVTKKQILLAAVSLLREGGEDAISARAIAQRLGTSTQPVFSNYLSMDDLRADVMEIVNGLYLACQAKVVAENKYPPYKAMGMAYIRFATEEPRLFAALYLRRRDTGEQLTANDDWRHACARVAEQTGLTEAQAAQFQLETWACVHGLATMAVTGFLNLSEEQVSEILTDVYQGLRSRFEGGKA